METSRGSDLHRACMNGNLRRVQDSVSRIRSKEKLQQKLVNPEGSILGHSPLHEAAGRGHHAVLTFLLKCVESSHAVNCLTSDGSTPLHLAVKMGHDQCVISLVPRLLPSFLSHTVQKTGREPGRFDYVRDDVLCVVLCVVLVIELSPTHAVLYYSARCQSSLVDCHST